MRPTRILAAAAVIAALVTTSAPAAVAAPSVRSGVDDFTFSDYEADFYLGTDDQGRSTLRSVERFTAVFPDFDQNHGMVRAIPLGFDGHPVDLELVSVTDENGDPRPSETEQEDGYLYVTSADRDFVHGSQTYVFTTEAHNVTRAPSGAPEEFVWDTNGSEARQPVTSLSARVHLTPELAERVTGDLRCDRGSFGSLDPCAIASELTEDGVVITASARDLAAFQNVTLAVGFEPGTFVARDDSYFASPFSILQLLSTVLAAFGLALVIWIRRTSGRDAPGYPSIVAQYEEPENVEPLSAALLLGKRKKAPGAQLLSFAVARMIDIIEGEPRGLFRNKPRYLIRVTGAPTDDAEKQRLFDSMLGSREVGTEIDLSDTRSAFVIRVAKVLSGRSMEAVTRGWKKSPSGAAIFAFVVAALGLLGSFVFGIVLGVDARGGGWPVLPVVVAFVAVLVALPLAMHWRWTEEGARLRDYLKGLELYIRLAEADRIRVLQGPETAERRPAAADDPAARLALWEKLLPWAMVFDLEQKWAAELGTYYEQQPPTWYAGTAAFTAVGFTSSMSSLSSSTSATFGATGSSSGSGGSSFGGGGGGSGGGGGGGGTGGV